MIMQPDCAGKTKQNNKKSKFEGMAMHMSKEESESQQSKVLMPRGILGQKYKDKQR